MRHRTVILILFLLLGLVACGGGGGGGSDNASGEGQVKAPVAVITAPQTIENQTLVTLDGSSSTASDGDIVTYQWKQVKQDGDPDVALVGDDTAQAQFTPQVPINTVLKFQLTVTDSGNRTGSATVTITVVNSAPTAIAVDKQVSVNDAASGVTLDGSASTDPDNNITSYQWEQVKQDGDPIATLTEDSTATPTATFMASASAGSSLTFKLTVTDAEGKSSSVTCKVSVGLGELGTQKQAQDLLYTAYAGIGYGSASSTSDDEPLYDIMVADLNTIAGDFVWDTISNDSNMVTKLFAVLAGTPKTFSYTTSSGVVSSLYLSRGKLSNGYWTFSATLSLNFNGTAYTAGNGKFYGDGGGVDLTADVTGYFKATTSGLEAFYVRSVTIQAKHSLRAVYPLGEITYGASDGSVWQIAYTVYYGSIDPTDTTSLPWNVQLIPFIVTTGTIPNTDFRDYTLSGVFALDGNEYQFSSGGMRYRQWQYDYIISGVRKTLYPLAVSGMIQVPGIDNAISISSPTDTSDPINNGTIVRSETGIWTSGHMSMSGEVVEVLATFNNDSDSDTCNFTGRLGDWSVAGWQNNLEP